MPLKFFQQLPDRVHRAAEWRGIPWLRGLIALLDFLVMFIPSDIFLIAAVLGFQKRTAVFAAAMTLGRVAGTVVCYFALQNVPLETLHSLAIDYHLGGAYDQGQYFFEKFGALSVGITALTPFPMLFPAAMSTVAGAPLWQLALSTLIGGGVRYAILCAGIVAGKELYLEHFPSVKKVDGTPKDPQRPTPDLNTPKN